MEYFKTNPNYYQQIINSYTSNDEYNANKRVHINNEIPPFDYYDFIHSKIKNDFWSWFLGTSKVINDVEYNMETNGEEVFDEEGYLQKQSIAKYVNGIRVPDYGPTPYYVYGPGSYDKRDVNGNLIYESNGYDTAKQPYVNLIVPTYQRVEIDGSLLPEMDFLLHEGVRYLDVLYPNHPNFIDILTNNEINDEITHAASLIDYAPNMLFFDWLSTEIDYVFTNSNEADYLRPRLEREEATKLKIRNLTNHAFRRKLYGSKNGYSQFGADVFQHVSVFQVAEYLPFLPINRSLYSGEYIEDPTIEVKWYTDYEQKPDEFKDRSINKYDILYKHMFRLIDWKYNNHNIEFYRPPEVIYGTAYPTPLSVYDIYEYPITRSTYVPLTMDDDFVPGQKVQINGHSIYLNAINYESSYEPSITLNYKKDNTLNEQTSRCDIETLTNTVIHIKVDAPVYPVFTSFSIYNNVDDLIKEYIDKIGTTIYEDNEIDKSTATISKLITPKDNYIPNFNNYGFVLNPYQNGNLYMNGNQFLTLYEDYLNCAPDYTPKNEEVVCFEMNGLFLKHNDEIPFTEILSEYFDSLTIIKNVKIEYNAKLTNVDAWFETDYYREKNHQEHQHNIPRKAGDYFWNLGDKPFNKIFITLSNNARSITVNSIKLTFEIVTAAELVFENTVMNDSGFIKQKDILVKNANDNLFAAEVTGINNGWIDLTVMESNRIPLSEKERIEAINLEQIPQYGLELHFNKISNQSGQKVVVFGRPIFTFTNHYDGFYTVNTIKFYISAIPRKKDHNLMMYLYEGFNRTCLTKFQGLEILYGPGRQFQEKDEKGKPVSGYENYRLLYEKYEIGVSSFKTFSEMMPFMIKQNYLGLVHPNDSAHWQRIRNSVRGITDNMIIHLEGEDHLVQTRKSLQEAYDKLVVETDTQEVINSPTLFEENCLAFQKIFNEYYEYYNNYIISRIACSIDREYYLKEKPENLTPDKAEILQKIKDQDKIIDTYQANMGLMFSPLPADIYMTNINANEQLSYSLAVNQDVFGGILLLSLDKWYDQIIYTKNDNMGKSGLIDYYDFGSINTVTIVDNNKDVNLIGYNIVKPSTENNLLKEYVYNEIKYSHMNDDIIKISNLDTNTRKFSYATPSFLELFLTDEMKNNVTGQILQFNEIQILCLCEINSNIVTVIDKNNTQLKIGSLTVGDTVFGKGIENDYYITEVNQNKSTIAFNKPLISSGELVLTFNTKINLNTDENKYLYQFKTFLAKSGFIDSDSIFNHGYFNSIEYPYLSNYSLNNIIDIYFYNKNLLEDLFIQPLYKRFFNVIVNDIHGREQISNLYYSIPSLINNKNLFLELNAYKTYKELNSIKSQSLKQKFDFRDNREYLIPINLMDYFESYLYEYAKAADNVNLGVNINAQTKTNGKLNGVTIIENNKEYEYSDPAIDIKFITYNWAIDTVPYYADIGIGKLDKIFDLKNIEKEVTEDEEKAYWNWSIYDNADITETRDKNKDLTSLLELKERGIELSSNSDRAFWFKKDFKVYQDELLPQFYSIDIPIMRTYLGEYEIQKLIKFEQYPKKYFTTINFSILKQDLTINKTNETKLKFINNEFFKYDIFKNNINLYGKSLLYNSTWTPSSTKIGIKDEYGKDTVEEENIINWPEGTSNTNINYKSIIEEKTFYSTKLYSNEEKSNITFRKGSIIIYEKVNINEKDEYRWVVKTFVYTGLYGDENVIITDIPNAVILNSYNPQDYISDDRFEGNEDLNGALIKSLLIKIILSLDIFKININLNLILLDTLKLMYIKIINDSPFGVDEKDLLLNQLNIKDLNFDEVFNTDGDKIINSYKINSDNIFWFTFIGFGEDIFFSTKSIKRGDNFALIYFENNFYVSLLNENNFLFFLEMSQKININQEEFFTAIGKYGAIEEIFTPHKINKYINKIPINYKNLLPGSVDINIELQPYFIGTGKKYNSDGTLGSESKKVNLTSDLIYYDETNNKLFTYNSLKEYDTLNLETKESTEENVSTEKIKLSIDQEENKYFKNLLYIYGRYQKIPEVNANSIIDRAVVYPIVGVPFDVDNLSLQDRILRIDEIDVRSEWEKNLESVFYSSYCNIEGIFKGIYIEPVLGVDSRPIGENKYINVNYKYGEEFNITADKFKFASELYKLMPIKQVGTEIVNFQDTNIDFENAVWKDSGVKLNYPLLKHADFTKVIDINNDSPFSYYKNLLVLEGEIDIFEPNLINFNRNRKLQDALNFVKVNDLIKNIIPISDSQYSSYEQIEVCNIDGKPFNIDGNGIFNIQYIDFRNNILTVVSNDRIAFKYLNSLDNLPAMIQNSDKSSSPGLLIPDVITSLIANNNGENSAKVHSMSWDEDNQKWLIGYREKSQSNDPVDESGISRLVSVSAYSLDNLTVNNDIEILDAYNTVSRDINTYQFIPIIDENFNDERFNTYARVLARDISFIKPPPIEELNSIRIGDISISSESISSGVLKIENGDTFKSLSFIIENNNKNDINIIVKSEENGTETHSVQLLLWDERNQRYFKKDEDNSETGGGSETESILNYNRSELLQVVTYIVPESYFEEQYKVFNGMSNSIDRMPLIPAPDVSEDVKVAAILLKGSPFYSIEFNKTGTGQVNISDITISDVPTVSFVNKEIEENVFRDLINGDYKEGPHFPHLDISENGNGLDGGGELYPNARRFSANNAFGQQAVLLGDSVFFYTPVETYVTTKDNDGKDITAPGPLSIGNHWTKGRLPSKYIATSKFIADFLDDQTANENFKPAAYLNFEKYLVNLKDLFIKDLNSSIETLSSGYSLNYGNNQTNPTENDLLIKDKIDAINSYRNVLYTITERTGIPESITVNGFSLIYTPDGVIPEFGEGDTEYKQSDFTQSVTINGKIQLAYKENSHYYQYLTDMYTYLLSNEYTTYFDDNGIKDITLSENMFIAQTESDDIITLDIMNTSSRSKIEEYENWSIKNLDINYVFPDFRELDDDGTPNYVTIDKAIKYNGQIIRIPVKSRKNWKAYHILDKYVEKNVQIYVGYIQANESVLHAFIRKIAGIDESLTDEQARKHEDYITAKSQLLPYFPELPGGGEFNYNRKHPVIFFSDNSGLTFENITIPNVSSIITGTEGEEPNPDDVDLPLGSSVELFEMIPALSATANAGVERFEHDGKDTGISIRCNHIVKVGNELRVYYYEEGGKEIGLLGYTSFIIGESSEGTFIKHDGVNHYANGTPSPNPPLNELNKTPQALGRDRTPPTDFENVPINISNPEADNLKTTCKRFTVDNHKIAIDALDPNVEQMTPSNKFYIEKRYQFTVSNVEQRILELGQDFITYNGVKEVDIPGKPKQHEVLRVLVTIDQTTPIENNTKYLEYKPEYLGSSGRLLANMFKKVDSLDQANRMYSYREDMFIRNPTENYSLQPPIIFPREVEPRRGVPSISEDEKDKRVYVWEKPFEDSKGNIINKYKHATNSAGQTVYLCNMVGDYLIEQDSFGINNYHTLQRMIEGGVPYQSLVPAPIVVDNFVFEEPDQLLQDHFNELSSLKVKRANFDKMNPNMLIDTTDINKLLEFLIENDYLYRWPLEKYWDDSKWGPVNIDGELKPRIPKKPDTPLTETSTQDEKDAWREWNEYQLDAIIRPIPLPNMNRMRRNLTSGAISSIDIEDDEMLTSDFFDMLEFLDDTLSPGVTDFQLEDRIAMWEYSYKGKLMFFVKDVTTNCLIMKHYDTMKLKISVPYEFAQGQKLYRNQLFRWDNLNDSEYLITSNPNYEINGVYLHAKGYGGTQLNQNFINRRPEEIDPAAFERKLVKNKYGEYIYVFNSNNFKYESKNGLFWLETNENVKINYENLNKDNLNTIKFYKDDHDYCAGLFTDYNVYKLLPSPIEVYTPKDTVYFNSDLRQNTTDQNGDGPYTDGFDILLTVFKIYKAGITVDENLLKQYTIEARDEENNLINEIKYSNGMLLYEPNNELKDRIIFIDDYHLDSYPNDPNPDNRGKDILADEYDKLDKSMTPKFINDKIFIHVTDELGQKLIYELKVAPFETRYLDNGVTRVKNNKEVCKIVSITSAMFNNNSKFDDEESIKIRLDLRTVRIGDYISSEYYELQTLSEQKDNNNEIEFYYAAEKEYMTVPFYINYILPFKLDIRTYDLKVLVNKFWYCNEIEEIESALYSGDQLCSKLHRNFAKVIVTDLESGVNETIDYITYSKIDDDDEISLENALFSQVVQKKEVILRDINIKKWIYTAHKIEDEIFTYNSIIIVDGLFGPILLNKPNYQNFNELVNNEGLIIELEKDIIDVNSNKVLSIGADYSNFKLQDLVLSDKYNNGAQHFIKFKILPINTIYPDVTKLNDPEYIQEVNSVETTTFGYDRVYINENSYPPPPITIRNNIYNKESIPYYYKNSWLNKNGFKIYLCDQTGKFIEPIVRNAAIEYRLIGDENGNCINNIYANIDPRFNLQEPHHKFSIDRFLSYFWIKDKEINPFNTIINIRDIYDNKLKTFTQKVTLNKYERFNDTFILKEIEEDSYVESVRNSIDYFYDIYSNLFIQNTELNYIDYVNGYVNFILSNPSELYHYEKEKMFYGIRFTNSFSLDNLLPNEFNHSLVWSGNTELNNKLQIKFINNTKENILNKNDKDTGIVSITEMGLFNRAGELIAYVTHPIVQYRSDSQHISYSLLLEEVGK